MREIRRIVTESEAAAAYHRQNPQGRIPYFIFHDPHYEGIVLCFMEDGKQTGLSFGAALKGGDRFYLHHFSVEESGCSLKTVCLYLDMLFGWLRKKTGARQVMISIPQEDMREPPLAAVLKKVPSCRHISMVYVRHVGMNTCDFAYLRQFRWYCPDLLEKKQYEAVPWKYYDPIQIRRLREAETFGLAEEGYLSPGVWEPDLRYEEKTSFVLLKKGEPDPLGWIITEETENGQAVKLRRFYIYKKARKKLLGPAFATWVLDVIAQHYKAMYYHVVQGNRQMEMFTDCYGAPILRFSYYHCNIIADL